MQIRVFATLRMVVGGAKVTLQSGPGNTFRELLDELVSVHPGLQEHLFKDGELSSRIHVFLNGRDIRYLGGIDMQIPEDGEVLIFPPVGGGPMIRHEYHGVPQWLMKEYLADLGAVEQSENLMVAEGWQAVVGKAEPNHIGSLVIGGAAVEFSGNQAALDALFKKLHWKTLRGGG